MDCIGKCCHSFGAVNVKVISDIKVRDRWCGIHRISKGLRRERRLGVTARRLGGSGGVEGLARLLGRALSKGRSEFITAGSFGGSPPLLFFGRLWVLIHIRVCLVRGTIGLGAQWIETG
jgi:hypothetical protein